MKQRTIWKVFHCHFYSAYFIKHIFNILDPCICNSSKFIQKKAFWRHIQGIIYAKAIPNVPIRHNNAMYDQNKYLNWF